MSEVINTVPFWGYIAQALIAGGISGIAFWATVRTELKYMRRDIDSAHSKITKHIEGHHG